MTGNNSTPLTKAWVPPVDLKHKPGTAHLRSSSLFLRRNMIEALAMLVVAGAVLTAIFAPFLTPYDPTKNSLEARLQPPSLSFAEGGHFLGTDSLGRDILARIIYGARVSLLVGFSSVLVMVLVGGVAGLVAGYAGGYVDSAIMRLTDIQLSIPFLVLAIVVAAVLGPGLTNVVLVLVIIGWTTYSRVVRAEVLRTKVMDYVEAARCVGCRDLRILFSHILPNAIPSSITIATLEMARMITAEASLSYLGLGVQPPLPSWGSMVAEGQDVIWIAYWVSLFPGLAIFITVVSFNLLGDWLRDQLDPASLQTG